MGTSTSKGTTRSSFDNLPDTIVADIFSLLPIKSIIRCRAVCKAWFRLISGIDFNRTYQMKDRVGLDSFWMDDFETSLYLPGFTTNGDTLELCRDVNRKSPPKCDTRIPMAIGCCNGLIFVLDYDHSFFYIWNPILGEYISVPYPNDTFETMFIRKPLGEAYGFGYCPITGDYKVLRIQKCNSMCHVLTIDPYATRTTWKSVSKSRCGGNLVKIKFCFFNGVIHWICGCGDYTHLDWISCFDLKTEKQLSLYPPRGISRRDGHFVKLTVLGNCMCLVNHLDNGIVLWFMKNYGVTESWTKHSYIRNYARATIYSFIFVRGGDLCHFNCVSETGEIMGTTMEGIEKMRAFSYIPSFVPLLQIFQKIPLKIKKPIQHNGWLRFIRNTRLFRRICIKSDK